MGCPVFWNYNLDNDSHLVALPAMGENARPRPYRTRGIPAPGLGPVSSLRPIRLVYNVEIIL